jgi:uncharacterized protein (DUF1697 family)
MPTNCKMADLKQAFESAGFTDVKTILASGNVVFSARRAAEGGLERKAEAAMFEHLGHAFLTIVRPIEGLQRILVTDPYDKFGVSPKAKRIVTFLRAAPTAKLELPIEADGARILIMKGKKSSVPICLPLRDRCS